MNISETVSQPLVQMPRASGRITVNDLNYTLKLEINNFTRNLIPGTVKSILHLFRMCWQCDQGLRHLPYFLCDTDPYPSIMCFLGLVAGDWWIHKSLWEYAGLRTCGLLLSQVFVPRANTVWWPLSPAASGSTFSQRWGVTHFFWAILDYCYYCYSVAQFCLTLCDAMDCSPPSFSVHGVF